MDINDIKKHFENIIHDDLYGATDLLNSKEDKINEICEFLNKSKNILEDIRTLFSTKNSETCFAYDKYLLVFMEKASIFDKLELLNNQEKYEDLTTDSKIYLDIWDKLSNRDKIEYLKNKKKYNNNDIRFINNSIEVNAILKEILNNVDIRKKIDPFTIDVPLDNDLIKKIDLLDFELCNIFTKESYTKLLLKHVSNFTEFKSLYEKNNKIYNLILNNSLRFKSDDNELIYSFIMENNNFIGKFSDKYLDIFSILEITSISKKKTLDNDAYSTIIQKLYLYNKDKASEYFNEDNLKRCSKHSISVNPFDDLNDTIRKTIFNTYTLFNKFIDTIMIEAINNYFEEQDILDILRNDKFINDTSSYAIELLLNKLSFKSAFNMMQRKVIFNKISHLNVEVTEKDAIFIKGYLDSPILLYKSDHNMIFEMLKLLNSKDVLYYLTLPYVNETLSSYEIIKICLDKKLKLNEIIKNDSILSNLKTTDIINLIDSYWENNVDLNIFKNSEITKLILNLTDKQIDSINFDEVNYLFETIRMKSLLSKQTSKITISSYKAVLACYLTLGMEETLEFISNGNMRVDLNEVKELQKMIVDEQILLFKQNNSAIFMNMDRKLIDNLLKINSLDNINAFAKELRRNTYIDNILYIMLDNEFDNYNSIIDRFYSFTKYYSYNEYQSKKEMYEYTNLFVNCYINKKVEEFNESFEKIILNNFKPKENILYRKRKELGKEYLKDLKLKIFIRALGDKEKDLYRYYFEDNYDLSNLKDDYVKYLAKKDVEYENILEHVLIPLSNDRFDEVNCLSKLGIKKPDNFDNYIKYNEDIKRITLLNIEIEELKSNDFTVDEFILIMNNICYKNNLPFKVKNNIKRKLNKLKNIIDEINGQVYIDKSALRFIYNDNMDIYNTDEIIEYKKYIEILEKIIAKTFSFINSHMNEEKLKNYFNKDYTKAIDDFDYNFPVTNKYYELKKRVFSLADVEKIFNGYDISNYKKMNNNLKDLLFKKNNAIMIADGYYDGVVDNLGVIINKWNNIEKYAQDLDIDVTNLTLISIETILRVINFEDNVIGNSISKKVIKNICDDIYYEELNVDERISMLIDLYSKSYSKVKATIPYITYIDDSYKVEIIDNYNQESLMSFPDSLYKVGAIGNDFLHYSILNKNGFSVVISKDNEIIARSLGVRNGNSVYLNYLEGINNDYYDKLLKSFANKIIEETEDTDEPIEFVMIVNNNIYNSHNSLRIDTTMCPIVKYPINEKYIDYDQFIKNNNLINQEKIYTNYDDGITTLLASSRVVDKNNFKYYDADAKYFRKRNKVMKLSNNVGEEILNKIETIVNLCKKENVIDSDINVILSMVDTIYLGDDFVLFITKRFNVIKYILPYDERAINEVNLIINSLNIKEEI